MWLVLTVAMLSMLLDDALLERYLRFYFRNLWTAYKASGRKFHWYEFFAILHPIIMFGYSLCLICDVLIFVYDVGGYLLRKTFSKRSISN